MIEVILDQTGDRAEADDAEAAVVAARTLCQDVRTAVKGCEPLTCSFRLDGKAIRLNVPENALWALGVIA